MSIPPRRWNPRTPIGPVWKWVVGVVVAIVVLAFGGRSAGLRWGGPLVNLIVATAIVLFSCRS